MDKECITCKQVYPEKDYYTIYTTRKDGSLREYTYKYCKYCHYDKMKPKREAWVKANPERTNELVNKAVKKWKSNLPAGIYMIQTDKGSYIGQSAHIQHRITQHMSSKQFGVVKTKHAKIISWNIIEYIDDETKRKKRERYWIKKLQPELNINFK